MDQKIEPNGYDWMNIENDARRVMNDFRRTSGLTEIPLLTHPIRALTEEELNAYDETVPGIKARILQNAQKEAQHRLTLEHRKQELEIIRRKQMQRYPYVLLALLVYIVLMSVVMIKLFSGWSEHIFTSIGSCLLIGILVISLGKERAIAVLKQNNIEILFYGILAVGLCLIQGNLIPILGFSAIMSLMFPISLILVNRNRNTEITN